MRTLRSAIPPALLLCLLAGIRDVPARALGDESIYLSQVDPAAPALPFAPSRSRGITVIVARSARGTRPSPSFVSGCSP